MRLKTHLFLLTALLTVAFLSQACAQQDKSKRPSPPAEAKASVGDLSIAINYNSPAVKGREIWGKLVPYGKVWRTGANEATTFEVNADVTINGQALPAGKYALLSIPTDGEWTLIFNKEAGQWGAYNYDEEKDVLRVNIEASKAAEFSERMTFKVDDNGQVTFNWENMTFSFMVTKA